MAAESDFAVMPRDYQKELLPVAIDADENLTHGLWRLNFGVLARAIDRAAWWLERNLGKPNDFPAIAYVGVGDMRYHALFVGAIKVGYKTMFPSLANPLEGNLKLLDDVQSRAVLYSTQSAVGCALARASDKQSLVVPELEYFVQPGECTKRYSYDETPADSGHDPICIFSTAGTTGFPKAIVCTHAHLAARQAAALPISAAGRKDVTKSDADDKRRLIFGSMGYVSMLLGLIGPVFGGRMSVLPPLHLSQPDFEARLFDKLAQAGGVQSAFVFPKLAMDIAKDERSLKVISGLKHVSFGGGPLPEEVRNRLMARTQVNDCWSSTETGVIAFQESDADAPGYLVVDSPAEMNVQFQPYTDRLYELCIVKTSGLADQAFAPHQAVFDSMPHVNIFRTGDLFSQHAHKAYHWKPEGRMDDTIVLSLGQSVNPGPTEQACLACAGVQAAIGTGQLKPTLGLLVELDVDVAGDSARRTRVLDMLHAAVRRVNALRQSFERVRVPEGIVVADRPLPRSAKGLVQRRRCIDMYRPQIDACW